jgi:demethylmenaquinone methyltransferase/2-methoxy-6-polyprenyl-1,4-benzoquinol methylase
MPDRLDPDFLDQQQVMFTRIALRYDLMNHLMTGWRDNAWRRYTIKQLSLPHSGKLLDLGSGTGMLALEAKEQFPKSKIFAADLTIPMMELVDGYNLPFPSDSLDGVVSSFLVRNLSDPHQGLTEQYRVLKPGGKIAILETSRRPKDFLSPLIRLYMYNLIPMLSGIFTGNKGAYTYLYESTESFLRAEELAAYLAAVGFKKVLFKRFILGMIAVHWGEK